MPSDSYWSIIMRIFSARNGHETKLLIYFQERKIREKLLLNEGTMMKVFRVIKSWCKKVFRKIKRWMMKPFKKKAKPGPEEKDMAFFNSAVTVLQTLVIALSASLGVWGVVNLLEGYDNDNPGANAQVTLSNTRIRQTARTSIPERLQTCLFCDKEAYRGQQSPKLCKNIKEMR